MEQPENPMSLLGKTVMLHGSLRGTKSGSKGVIYAIFGKRPQVRFIRTDGDPANWGVDWSMISLVD